MNTFSTTRGPQTTAGPTTVPSDMTVEHPQPDRPLPPPARDPGQSRLRGARTATVVAIALVAGALGGGAATLVGSSGSGDDAGSASNPTTLPASSAVAGRGLTNVERVASAVSPSVVLLQVRGGRSADEGSGVILSKSGLILTNNHVIAAAASGGKITAVLNDGTSAPATIVGRDPVTDLAVVQARGLQGLTPARLGNSADLRVGEQVVAVGAPLGLQGTVTTGIVSAMDRPVSSTGETGQSTVTDAIQTDAAVNPGNSGGPLVDMAGSVIGVNSSIASLNSSPGSQAGSIGLGFAIPIDQVRPIVHQIESGRPVTHAELGVSITDSTDPVGAVIRSVQPGSAAARAGLRAGDVITRAGNQLVNDADALVAAVRNQRPSSRLALSYTRDGHPAITTATLGSDHSQG
jgi:putative serine protease PepD